ncbi:MAG: hypothetical protein KDB19_08810 [Microthrixaceae bacterium]|nr:hypothetical protein [Microthrixaceae bacterium]MCB9375135.1 hypothetical protein [Microthrixaceae bacterium]
MGGGTSFAAAPVAGFAIVVVVLATVTAAAVVAFVAVELRRSVPLRVPDTHPWISGSPAEATVVSVESGDGVRNHVTVQCLVEFEVLEAGHRNPIPFVVDCLLPADVVPSAGDCWSARVNATPLGPVVVVAPPDGASRDSIDAEIAAMERDRRHDAA